MTLPSSTDFKLSATVVLENGRIYQETYLCTYETDDRSMKNCENQVTLAVCIWKFVSSYCTVWILIEEQKSSDHERPW